MSELLPLPPELQHLVEKRTQGERRRHDRRRKRSRRQVDLGPLGSIESASKLDQIVLEERRTGGERRKGQDRRRRARRRTDPPSS